MRADGGRCGRVAGWLLAFAALVAFGVATNTATAPAGDAGTAFRAEHRTPQAVLLPAGSGKPAVWGSRSDPRVTASRATASETGLAADPSRISRRPATGWLPVPTMAGAPGHAGSSWPYQGRAPPHGQP